MLNKDFREFIESLNSNKVKYLVLGGYAIAFHGHPRYTKDLDVWLELSEENAANVMKALVDFGFGDLDISKDDFLHEGMVIQLGYPPNRIDLINSPDGVNFAECYASRIEIDIDGLKVSIIDLENLKKNKKASGRLQDLADLEKLGDE
jgi:predicted nucleotidyltransferase